MEKFTAEHVRNAIAAIVAPGATFEIRALDAMYPGKQGPVTLSGYFKFADPLCALLPQIQARGIYLTLNPCNADLFHRAPERLEPLKRATSDADILSYRWLYIDCDPKRPPDCMATEEEHQAAIDRALAIRQTLSDAGWHDPLLQDSGSGAHLLYRIDIPNDAAGRALVKNTLAALARRFSDDLVKLDTAVSNPARICRLAGTINAKGQSTGERPHRMCKLLDIPQIVQPVPMGLLNALAKDVTRRIIPVPDLQARGQARNAHLRLVGSSSYATAALTGEYRAVAQAPVGERNTTLNKAAFKLAQLVAGGELSEEDARRELLDAATVAGLSEQEAERTYLSALRAGSQRPRTRTRRMGASSHSTRSRESLADDDKLAALASEELDFVLACLERDEVGDAELFARLFRGQVIHDVTEGVWYVFGPHHWHRDVCNAVKLRVSGQVATVYLHAAAALNLQIAKLEAQSSAAFNPLDEPPDADRTKPLKVQQKMLARRALELRKASRISNVLSLVIPQPGMAIESDRWDAEPWLLPVVNGTIELRTGTLRPGRAEDYVRTYAPVEWAGLNAPAPRWQKLLEEVFADREEGERAALINFLQRTLGYGITGLTSEEIFLILYGAQGRNGKDTIMGLIEYVLGRLAGAISSDVFLSTGRFHTAGSATPHLVDLQGKRIAHAQEPESGARFNVSQLKTLTGGGTISARQLHGRQYAFHPTHLLVLLTNHRPHADASDEAFWARPRMITFNMRFVDNPDPNNPYERKTDKSLKHALKEEAAGILAWLVRGCLAWQDSGLQAPDSVLADVRAYQASEDEVQRFIDDCCIVKPGLRARASQLQETYLDWCRRGNSKAMPARKFLERLAAKGFKKEHTRSGKFYHGIGLLDSTPPDESGNNEEENAVTCDGSKNIRHTSVTQPQKPAQDSFGDDTQKHPSQTRHTASEAGLATHCDGCDGKTHILPLRDNDFLNFEKKVIPPVTSVTAHPFTPPGEPCDASVTDRKMTRHNPSHPSHDDWRVRMDTVLPLVFTGNKKKLCLLPGTPTTPLSASAYRQRLLEALAGDDEQQQAARRIIENWERAADRESEGGRR